jgi:hypothetical protein
MKNKELSFYAHPLSAGRWQIPTPFGNYIIHQEEDTLGDDCYWIETPAGHRLESEAINALDETEQIVSHHYHKHYML